MEERRMTTLHITSRLRGYLKKHKDELTYATTKFAPTDVTNFEVCIEENYSGKDYYSFNGKMEIKNPLKDGITEWISIGGKVYVEEGEDHEPKFGEVKTISLY